MNLERYIYLDIPGLAGLYAQLRGEDVVETLISVEHSRASGLKLALAAFLGLSGGGESTKTKKESRTVKKTLRPENMLREIIASLKAHGSLRDSLVEARKAVKKNGSPVWFDARHPFSVPPTLDEFNRVQTVLFVSGFPPYENPSRKNPPTSMTARLQNFPSARDGQLSPSGHDALLFRQLNGKPYRFSVFGTVFESGDSFQVKPYAIRL